MRSDRKTLNRASYVGQEQTSGYIYMTRIFFIFLAFIIQIVLLTCGCEKSADRSSQKSMQKSPGETVTAFYTAANKEQYQEAERYLSADVLGLLKSQSGPPDDGIRKVLDQATRNRSIVKITIEKDLSEGGKTVVHYTLHFRDGTKENGNKILIREQKTWKLTTW